MFIWWFPTLHHNEPEDFTTAALCEVCHDVAIEPVLQLLAICLESLQFATADVKDEARLDVKACGFWEAIIRELSEILIILLLVSVVLWYLYYTGGMSVRSRLQLAGDSVSLLIDICHYMLLHGLDVLKLLPLQSSRIQDTLITRKVTSSSSDHYTFLPTSYTVVGLF